jgi:hypothetical protein
MRRLIPTAASLLFLVEAAAAQVPDCKVVPGWRQEGPARSFVADNLFDYMDGNAEGYLIYRFVVMRGVTCRSGDNSILIDISEMADPEFAFGLFMSNRDPRQPLEAIGMRGQVLPRRATFAKDKYYVELAANPAGDHTASLRAFVAALEKGMSGRTKPPECLGWFPAEGLVEDSVRLVPQSVLGIRLLTKGYVGQYEFGKGFLVTEASPEAAVQLMTRLKERFEQTNPVKIADEAFTSTDKYLDGLCVFRKGRFIGGFANLKEGRDGVAESSRLAANVQ